MPECSSTRFAPRPEGFRTQLNCQATRRWEFKHPRATQNGPRWNKQMSISAVSGYPSAPLALPSYQALALPSCSLLSPQSRRQVPSAGSEIYNMSYCVCIVLFCNTLTTDLSYSHTIKNPVSLPRLKLDGHLKPSSRNANDLKDTTSTVTLCASISDRGVLL